MVCGVPSRKARYEVPISVSVAVTSSDLAGSGGRVEIFSDDPGLLFEWRRREKPDFIVKTEEGGRVAVDLPCGEYVTRISSSSSGESIEVTSVVEKRGRREEEREEEDSMNDSPPKTTKGNLPQVLSYEVQHCTDDYSRDGSVTAKVENVPPNTSFLWTSGVVTKKPEINDVPPGTYSATPILEGGFSSSSLPARVLSIRKK